MIITTVAGLVFPMVLGILLDSAFEDKNISVLLVSLLFLGIVFVTKGIFNYLKTLKLAEISNRLVKDIRQHTFAALQRKSLSYFDNRKSGDIVSGLTNDIAQVQSTLTSGALSLVQAIISLITVVIALFSMEVLLASVTLLFIPLIIYSSKRLGKKVKPVSQTIRSRLGFITSIINESISGIDIIKLFKLEKRANEIFGDENEKLVNDTIKESKIKAANSLIVGLLFSLQFILMVALGSYRVFQGIMTPGSLIAFVLYADMVAGPVSVITGVYMEIKSASASLDRIKMILNNDSVLYELDGQSGHEKINTGDLKFINVSFSYEKETQVLKDVSFNIKPGEIAAFVGRSGAGKSTVLKLIPRFYDICKGEIIIDGINIKDYNISDLREHIAIVPQESFLFGMSIKDNILCGNPDANDDEVILAAKKANAHDFIMSLPDGYATVTGERGAKLSGGQRQRIAIARAFIKSPKILLLDEATSALDNESESQVQQAIYNLMKDRTVIVIAHRLSTIMNADVIFVMDEGRIIQQGTHKELLETSTVYKNLYNKMVYRDRPERIA